MLCSGSFSSQGIFYSPVTVEYFFKVMPMEMKKNQVKWETRTTKAFTVGRPAIEAKTLLFLIIFLNIKKKNIFFYRKCISWKIPPSGRQREWQRVDSAVCSTKKQDVSKLKCWDDWWLIGKSVTGNTFSSCKSSWHEYEWSYTGAAWRSASNWAALMHPAWTYRLHWHVQQALGLGIRGKSRLDFIQQPMDELWICLQWRLI